MSIVVKCKAIREMFKNGDFKIIAFEPFTPFPEELKLSEYFTFSVKGEIPYITIGKEYDLEIELISYDKRYGGAYKILSVFNLEKLDLHDLTREESFEILMDCTSSEKIANNILEVYPNFIETILINGKEAIDVKLIKGVGNAYLNAYVREITSKYKYYHIIQKFKDYKIDISDAKVLCDNYKDEFGIEKMIKENPYRVLKELGRSFENNDKMIMELRPDLKESEQRCAYLILSVLERNEYDGNTRLNGNILYNYIENEYNVPELLPLVVKVATENDLFYYDEKSKDLAIATTYLAECKIAEFVKDKIKNSIRLDIDWEKYKKEGDFELTENQLNCLKNFCEYNFSILAGYSGSGKSQSVQNLVSLMEDNHISYTLLSSTGKASKVLSESTHRKASTIHKRCYEGAINSDCIIIDEFGMVNLDTFIMLLNTITNENVRIVLCGDPAQLSAIGLSKIFDDLINSEKVPMTMLTEIFRYKSNGSLYVATNLRNGKSFFNDKEMVKYENGIYSVSNNYKFIECEENKISEKVISEYFKLINKGIKPKDIMVLSSFNVKENGTYYLNNALQSEINPPKPNEKYHSVKVENGKTTITFRVNDIVINTKNNYNAVTYENYLLMKQDGLEEEDVKNSIVINGQIGIIREVIDDGLIIQYDEELIYTNKLNLKNLLLGYAISIHKSQGSSSDYVITIISEQHRKMLTRGLLYVADTRCRNACIDIGSSEAFEEALKVVDNDLRRTWLLDLMIEGE